jgi:radical SAM-linked protein
VSSRTLPDRLRLRYAKLGRVRFTSQRDLARVMERAMRRAQLPLAHSAGFSPRPLMSFGLALPTGCASRAEFLDLRLDASATGDVAVVDAVHADLGELARLVRDLSALLPEGIDVTAAAALDGAEPSLQEAVASCDWELEVLGVSPAVLAERVGHLLGADAVEVARERKGRTTTDDIRPAVRALSVLDRPRRSIEDLGEVVALSTSLATHPRGVRPAELCGALGDDVTLLGACRTHQWIENDDRTERAEPLTEDGTVCGGLPARAEVQGG